uniref:C-type lectin domain family 2 member L-like n=1 Tax=Crocodylus porosus TaxID=8502 RepID=A0A7M4F3I4_CROPO
MEARGAAAWSRGEPAWLRRRHHHRRSKSDPGVLWKLLPPPPAETLGVCSVQVESPGGPNGSRRRSVWDHCSHLWFWRRIAGITTAVAVILLLLWYSWSPPRLPHIEPCPDDWLYYQKKCYYLSEEQADWTSSQNFCFAHGASLAVIESKQEMHFIMNRMRTRDFWIGLYKEGDAFHWLSGEALDTNLPPSSALSLVHYCSNAWDEGCAAGRCNLLIPTSLEAVL